MSTNLLSKWRTVPLTAGFRNKRPRTRFEAREQGREAVEKDQFVTRLAIILFLAAIAAGCTTMDTTTTSSTGSGNPYFLCRTADYVRHHIDVCSGILR